MRFGARVGAPGKVSRSGWRTYRRSLCPVVKRWGLPELPWPERRCSQPWCRAGWQGRLRRAFAQRRAGLPAVAAVSEFVLAVAPVAPVDPVDPVDPVATESVLPAAAVASEPVPTATALESAPVRWRAVVPRRPAAAMSHSSRCFAASAPAHEYSTRCRWRRPSSCHAGLIRLRYVAAVVLEVGNRQRPPRTLAVIVADQMRGLAAAVKAVLSRFLAIFVERVNGVTAVRPCNQAVQFAAALRIEITLRGRFNGCKAVC